MLVSRKLFFGRKSKREADRSYCSGTEFAFHIDRSAHQIHEGFDDRKAEAGSGDVAFGGGMFSCKFFKICGRYSLLMPIPLSFTVMR